MIICARKLGVEIMIGEVHVKMSNKTNTLLLNENSALIYVHVICRNIFLKRNRLIKVRNVNKLCDFMTAFCIINTLEIHYKEPLKSFIQHNYTRSQEVHK